VDTREEWGGSLVGLIWKYGIGAVLSVLFRAVRSLVYRGRL